MNLAENNYFVPEELIGLLKKRDWSHFRFQNGEAITYLYANELSQDIEISIEAPGGTIPEETADQMINVLEHLDECLQKAYVWLSRLDLKHDRWFPFPDVFPNEIEKIFIIYYMEFGPNIRSKKREPDRNRFSITFGTPQHAYFPLTYIVYYHHDDLSPFDILAEPQ